jgi:hypothetical protein
MGYDVNNIFPRTSNGNAKINGKIDHFDTLDSNVVSSNLTWNINLSIMTVIHNLLHFYTHIW